MQLWRRIIADFNPRQPWWVGYNPDPREPLPNWRGPRNSKPGQDRLRERLGELFACGAYQEFKQELGLSKQAVSRFMGGDNDALTPEQIKQLVRYVNAFGLDMSTGRFLRVPRRDGAAGKQRRPVEPRIPFGVYEPLEKPPSPSEETRARRLAAIDPNWR